LLYNITAWQVNLLGFSYAYKKEEFHALLTQEAMSLSWLPAAHPQHLL
jgi:hypothetical protein